MPESQITPESVKTAMQKKFTDMGGKPIPVDMTEAYGKTGAKVGDAPVTGDPAVLRVKRELAKPENQDTQHYEKGEFTPKDAAARVAKNKQDLADFVKRAAAKKGLSKLGEK